MDRFRRVGGGALSQEEDAHMQ
jgi:hypothetical protein